MQPFWGTAVLGLGVLKDAKSLCFCGLEVLYPLVLIGLRLIGPAVANIAITGRYRHNLQRCVLPSALLMWLVLCCGSVTDAWLRHCYKPDKAKLEPNES